MQTGSRWWPRRSRATSRGSARISWGANPDDRAGPVLAERSALLARPRFAFRTDKIEQPGNVNEYGFIGELDLIQGQLRTMATFDAPAMNREPGFARRPRIPDRLSWLASRHARKLAAR